MTVLQARFHPRAKRRADVVVVAEIRFDGGKVDVEPANVDARDVRPFSVASILVKVHFLLGCAGNEPVAWLTHFRSDYWSFVEVRGASARKGN